MTQSLRKGDYLAILRATFSEDILLLEFGNLNRRLSLQMSLLWGVVKLLCGGCGKTSLWGVCSHVVYSPSSEPWIIGTAALNLVTRMCGHWNAWVTSEFFFIQEMVELDALIVFSGRLRPGNLVKLCTLKLCVTWALHMLPCNQHWHIKMPSSDHSAMSNQPVMTCMCLVSKLSCFNSARSWWVWLLSTLGSGHLASTIYKG